MSKTTTTTTTPRVLESQFRALGAFVYRLESFSEAQESLQYFGDAAHVPVAYVVTTDRGPRTVWGWLPWPAWIASKPSTHRAWLGLSE